MPELTVHPALMSWPRGHCGRKAGMAPKVGIWSGQGAAARGYRQDSSQLLRHAVQPQHMVAEKILATYSDTYRRHNARGVVDCCGVLRRADARVGLKGCHLLHVHLP